MFRNPTRNSSLALMIKRAEFIKSRLMSSKKKEYGEDELLVKDLKALISFIENFDRSGGGGQMRIFPLPAKLFKKLFFGKESLIYRVDEIIELLNSELSQPQGGNGLEISDENDDEDALS
jgi:hypothetical protein